ncbi:MFS transporter [Providencia alcalifaciens]|uniref:Transporter, major facilitator family protein n=2 Tax=Providencia TaxID=586 RepID=B6XFC8_9GAMM|nr:MFS transporter [Providencia alcalifaciens]ATG16080.1 MFS transporter [Providencia alcalifaciens]EEB45687.1 transporter, major facilitator family protein [Providencia alcalifaciens DSM 30120]MTC26494.1 MFS transporter [Providencia alcalifaciens]MTC52058.1 MFS transporter [Providencia alcalifaciens]SPY65943.1 Proline porter II [Providencia alcalifaciens]
MKWKLRFGAVAGNALEFYDLAIFAAISSYLSAELTRLGYQQATEMVWGIFALRFIMRPIGGYVIGRYADKVGKKSALILVSIITGSATLTMGLLPIHLLGTYAPLVILILQMALSFSYAGEAPSLSAYLYKDSQPHERGRISGLLTGSAVVGVIGSLAIVLLLERILDVESMQKFGWRIPLLLGLANILICFWFRYWLPNQPIEKVKDKIDWFKALNIFLIVIPGSVIFYTLNFSSSFIIKEINIEGFRSIYAIMSSIFLLIFIAIIGFLTDKYSYSERVFKYGVKLAFVFSTPIYFFISNHGLVASILSQLVMLIISAMVLCNWNYAMTKPAGGHVTTFSMGYNIASVIIGGVTPMIISNLVSIHVSLVGVFVMMSTLALFLSFILSKKK